VGVSALHEGGFPAVNNGVEFVVELYAVAEGLKLFFLWHDLCREEIFSHSIFPLVLFVLICIRL
jgi:hypothetical protein